MSNVFERTGWKGLVATKFWLLRVFQNSRYSFVWGLCTKCGR
jgi:hypothetical protein